MSDLRLSKLARLLVRYCTQVRPGDRVGIWPYGSIAASLPLQAELVRELLSAGAHPHPYLIPASTDEFGYLFFSTAEQAQLDRPDPFADLVAREFDCDIYFLCESNRRRLSNIDPQRQAWFAHGQSAILNLYLERAARGEMRWVLSAYPTHAYAHDAEMSLEEYENFVYSAMSLDTEDPVSHWQAVGARQRALCDWLAGKRDVRVKGQHIDLSFSIGGRMFVNCDGRVNMPDGEIFTGPVEDSVNGWFESTYPAIFRGVDVGKVTFRLEGGVIVRADAEKHQTHLDKMRATDEGSHRIGEFGIGTNEAIRVFTKNMLLDEKMSGTVHLAAGLGFAQSGSKNQSAIHWDFLCDMSGGGKITIDDQPFYDSGRFLV